MTSVSRWHCAARLSVALLGQDWRKRTRRRLMWQANRRPAPNSTRWLRSAGQYRSRSTRPMNLRIRPHWNGGMLAQVVADFTSVCGQYRVSRGRLREYQDHQDRWRCTATIASLRQCHLRSARQPHGQYQPAFHSAGSFATLAARSSVLRVRATHRSYAAIPTTQSVICAQPRW
jgi:hypothetical protein